MTATARTTLAAIAATGAAGFPRWVEKTYTRGPRKGRIYLERNHAAGHYDHAVDALVKAGLVEVDDQQVQRLTDAGWAALR